MIHNRKNKINLLSFVLGFTICLVLMIGIVLVNSENIAHAEGEAIDTLEVAFNKTNVGDSLVTAFEFEDKATKKLKVPADVNYTATIIEVCRNGQKQTLWSNNNTSLLWDRVESQLIEQNVAYCIRVSFEPKTGYAISTDTEMLKRKLKVSGAELGKGKDIELWDSAGQNRITTAVQMDFVISKGMTYIGYPAQINPIIGEQVTGKIGTLYTDTGIWLRGAPGPYNFTIKSAPIGTELQVSNVFEESTCYYRVTAVNSMDGGTMYITAIAADGQTCDIPIPVAAVSGGHEHTWSDFDKIDFEYHGYTKCTDPSCPGVCITLDKGSEYGKHDFYSGCNVKCKKCGDLGNSNAKHHFNIVPDKTDEKYHVYQCDCGEFEKDESGNVIKEAHSGGVQTCLTGANCEVCGQQYLLPTGHKYEYRSFKNNDGTYTHLGFCKYCGIEDVSLRHSPEGGTPTCQTRAKCQYEHDGSVCGCEYGDFLPHNFVNGICTLCSSDEYIREVVIDVPEFYKGMAYRPLFYPNVIKGNVIDLGIYFYKAAYTRDGNSYLCGSHNFDTTFIKENSVILYAFKPQTNCKFLENVDDINLSLTHGEVLSKEIRKNDGALAVLVLLRVDSVVQSLDIDVSQPIVGLTAESVKVSEKNGYEITINNIGPLVDDKIYKNSLLEVEVTIKAPEGKFFQDASKVSLDNWLCDLNISGGKALVASQNADLTELTLTIQTVKAIECQHTNVMLKEAGKLETCTEDGVKDKYACKDCGKEFFDSACTVEWKAEEAIISKAHKLKLHEETACSEGKDGNIEYYECEREDCGKIFSDSACTKQILLSQTIIHDFNIEWSSNKDRHYHECKNCDEIRDLAAHRPDRTEATEEDPVKCLDCGYIITPALLHTTHITTLVDGEEATCMKEGRKPYYKCSGCELKFEDSEATKPITDESKLVIQKAHKFGPWIEEIPATEEAEGVKGHKDCAFCHKHFDEKGQELSTLAIAKLVKVDVEVVGGIGGGKLIVGETVTITANEPKAGKVFKCWKDANGNVVSTKRSYTFKVTGETTLTAVYEDAPKKKGLSGGAIAGIIVGSVVVVGIGGFAIFWFAIKKKTFVELADASKKIFTKKK